jgi:uncharacterized protein YecT (DUF1311 family)
MYKQLLLCTFLVTSSLCNAEQLGISAKFDKCVGSSAGSSVAGRRDCVGQERQRQDLRLNKAYSAAMSKLSPGRKEILRNGQRAWLKFFPPQCEIEIGAPTGGTDWTADHDMCLLKAVAARAKFLEGIDD